MPGDFNGASGSDPARSRRWIEAGGYLATLLVDIAMIAAALTVSVWVREWFRDAGWVRGQAMQAFALTHFRDVLVYFWVGLIVAFHFVDVYRERRFLTGNREAGRIVKAVGFFIALNAILAYLFPTRILFSRLTLGMAFVACSVFVLLGRWGVERIRRALRCRGWDTTPAIIIGTGPVAQLLAAELEETDHHGYRLLGFVGGDAESSGRLEGIRLFGGLHRLERVVRRLHVGEVFLAEPDWGAGRVAAVFTRLRPLGVQIRLVSRLYDSVIGRVGMPVDQIGETPILDFGAGNQGRLHRVVKRVMDGALALIFLVLLSPVMALIALAIWIESGRPVLHRQPRVKKGGNPFTCYKFRSMVPEAEKMQDTLDHQNELAGPMFKIRYDPRVTKVGRLIRRYSIDELPQLWNVLCGDMSLVGPRPPLAREVEQYEDWHHKRLRGPMGLTGLWQVSGRNELNFEEMALLDLYYLRNATVFHDLRILFKTAVVVLLGRGL